MGSDVGGSAGCSDCGAGIGIGGTGRGSTSRDVRATGGDIGVPGDATGGSGVDLVLVGRCRVGEDDDVGGFARVGDGDGFRGLECGCRNLRDGGFPILSGIITDGLSVTAFVIILILT